MLNESDGAAPRSYLYVPSDREDLLRKARGRGADALILDLEDAVPAAGKENARRTLARWLAGQRGGHGCELWVRINPGQAGADIAAAVTAAVAGVVVPKAEPALIAEVGELLAERERAIGAPDGRLRMLPLVETARGLLAGGGIAAAPRVARLGIGEADLAADLGMRPGSGREELLPLRVQIVVASAAAGIGAPVASASLDFRDLAGLRASTEALLRLGFRARTAIHPAQVAVINEVFTPTAEEVARARALIAAFEEAERRGTGVFADEDGRMVDLAVVRSAREILRRAPRTAGSAGVAAGG